MSKTLAALAWTESSAGGVVSSGDPSYGIYQAYLPTVLNRLKLKNDPIIYNLIKNKLINEESFSTAHAISELIFWKTRRTTWFSTGASYNGGYRHDSNLPQQYANKIYRRVTYSRH